MIPFKWGTFDEFLEVSQFEGEGIETQRGPADSHLGRIDVAAQGGAGAIEYFCSDSLRVVIFDCCFRDGREFNLIDAGWLRLNFGLSLSVDMTFGENYRIQANEPSWRFIRSPEADPVVEVVPAGARLQWITVCCRPDLLEGLTGTHLDDLPAMAPMEPCEGSMIHRCFRLTPVLQAATRDILGGRVQGRMRVPYIAAKAHELCVLAVDHMMGAPQPDTPVRLTDRDIRSLHAIRAFVDEHLSETPTVAELSLKVGMNRTKLFYGFKCLFGVSLSEHLQEKRIEEGYRLLMTTDEPVGDIAARIGFQHQCNFSTAFKSRYGVAPSAIRRGVSHWGIGEVKGTETTP